MGRYMLFLLLFAVFLHLHTVTAFGEDSPPPANIPPLVTIDTPKSGIVSTKILTIGGTVSDTSITTARIIHNGDSYLLQVRGGAFTRNIVASPGENWIEVIAENRWGKGKDTVFFKALVQPIDMKIIMTWDADGTDLDLWVTDPQGEKCFYSNRETAIGGLLDLDVTDGYGPETFTLPTAVCGNYLVNAHFYGTQSEQKKPVNVKVEVVLHGGTPGEVRKVYSTWLYKVNDVKDVCTILIQ